jgi:hypothetical protein
MKNVEWVKPEGLKIQSSVYPTETLPMEQWFENFGVSEIAPKKIRPTERHVFDFNTFKNKGNHSSKVKQIFYFILGKN